VVSRLPKRARSKRHQAAWERVILALAAAWLCAGGPQPVQARGLPTSVGKKQPVPAGVSRSPQPGSSQLEAQGKSLQASSAQPGEAAWPGMDAALMANIPLVRGGRDPFRLPPPPVPGAGRKILAPVFLPPGPRGLVISQLVLEGIVAENAGKTMIAVVTNQSRRAYFLHKNEMLYDGMVTRIVPGAVYFQEKAPTAGGADHFRVVVKRLSVQGESR
jgi:hypothetical protein